jgi:hypothetical protein
MRTLWREITRKNVPKALSRDLMVRMEQAATKHASSSIAWPEEKLKVGTVMVREQTYASFRPWRGPSLAPPGTGRAPRCAIYTRRSTEHNLDLAFNSLDAQRGTCEAYVKSQAHERWRLLAVAFCRWAPSQARYFSAKHAKLIRPGRTQLRKLILFCWGSLPKNSKHRLGALPGSCVRPTCDRGAKSSDRGWASLPPGPRTAAMCRSPRPGSTASPASAESRKRVAMMCPFPFRAAGLPRRDQRRQRGRADGPNAKSGRGLR